MARAGHGSNQDRRTSRHVYLKKPTDLASSEPFCRREDGGRGRGRRSSREEALVEFCMTAVEPPRLRPWHVVLTKILFVSKKMICTR